MKKRRSFSGAVPIEDGRILQSMIDTVRLGDTTRVRELPVCEPHCVEQQSHRVEQPHRVEQEVQRRLLSEPELRFTSLVIRRTPNGVCLEGVLETDSETPDVCALVRDVAGVNEVLNHLVVRRPVAQS